MFKGASSMKQITFLFIVSCFLISGCSGPQWDRTPVIENRDFQVVLEDLQEKGNTAEQKYAHPYGMSLAKLDKILGDLTYNEEFGLLGDKKGEPVFQEEEIQRLAKALADTLAKANAGQRIRFVSFNRGQTLIFSKTRKTEGIVFIQSPHLLNIAFSSINRKMGKNVSTGYASGTSHSESSYTDPLQIMTTVTPLAPVPSYAATGLSDGGKPAPMWIVADLAKLDQTLPETDIQKETVAEPDLRPQKGKAPAKNADVLPAETGGVEKNHEKLLQQKIKNQLLYLKGLLDEGLITEADYAAKKMELLKKIE